MCNNGEHPLHGENFNVKTDTERSYLFGGSGTHDARGGLIEDTLKVISQVLGFGMDLTIEPGGGYTLANGSATGHLGEVPHTSYIV